MSASASAVDAIVARKIYVISDLHLGGKLLPNQPDARGFRLCTHEAELASFIDALTALSTTPPAAIELVINGDIVDFLAEETPEGTEAKWSPFHYPEANAIARLNEIVKRSAIVFAALQRFLAAPRHRLVILPGNHDIELNLPAVRRRLRKAIVGPAGVADYEFIGHGEAYLVGDVLIEHGNRVDDMNFVDYHSLRHLCGLLSRGMAVKPEFRFDPPAGSKLVAEMMNPIKERYGFIDLLKPEGEAAFPVLLALEPGLRSQLGKLAAAMINGKARRAEQIWNYESNISAYYPPGPASSSSQPHPEETGTPAVTPEAALEEILKRTVGRPDFARPSAEKNDDGSVRPISLLSPLPSLWALLAANPNQSWETRLVDLRDALLAMQKPGSFDRAKETGSEYWNEAQAIAQGRGVRHVVFGHTHLARQVSLPDAAAHGDSFYFNCGAWADLLELPRSILDTNRQLLPMADLKAFVKDLLAQDLSRFETFRPTYVCIAQDSAGLSLDAGLFDYRTGEPVE